jgi:hypothetical protein
MAHDPHDTHINPPHVVFADDLSVSMADPDLERCQQIYADGGADALRAFIDERARVARLRDEGIPDACEPMTSHDLAQDYDEYRRKERVADKARIARLEAALRVLCDSVERIAFEMPPPNEYTPQFVQRAQAARLVLLYDVR